MKSEKNSSTEIQKRDHIEMLKKKRKKEYNQKQMNNKIIEYTDEKNKPITEAQTECT